MGWRGPSFKGSLTLNSLDLGQLDGPVLVFGGPNSNVQAARAVLAAAKAHRIAADHLICTGDVVAYCAQPSETISEIRASGCATIAGNCERQLATKQMDCGCGFEEGSACDRFSAGWYAHAAAQTGPSERQWMATLPDVAVFEHHGRRCAVIHGGVTDISRFLWSTSQVSEFKQEIAHLECLIGKVDVVSRGIVACHSRAGTARRHGSIRGPLACHQTMGRR